jgi:hypothetical protein
MTVQCKRRNAQETPERHHMAPQVAVSRELESDYPQRGASIQCRCTLIPLCPCALAEALEASVEATQFITRNTVATVE